MNKLIISTVFILGFTARAALAECTLNPDIGLPKVVTLETKNTNYAYYQPTASAFYPVNVGLPDFAAKIGLDSRTVLATCTDGESLIIENNESDISRYSFATTVSGVVFYSGIGDKNNTSSYDVFRIPTPTGGRQVIMGSGGDYTLHTIFKAGNNGINVRVDRPSYYTSGLIEQLFLFRISTADGKEIMSVYTNPFHVTNGTCRTNTYDNVVDFGELSMQSLKSPGATSKVVNFNINVSCGSSDIEPSIAFGGDTDSQNTNVFINSSGEGYSRGVGIQILRGNEVLIPGQELPLGGGSVAEIDYEFRGRVFRLNDELTEGRLDVPVTFSLTYQ
ncbi:fimbrial protein [Enterobacter ludwigii]